MHHLIIGLGDIAHAHARALRELGEQVSFCSRDKNKAIEFQRLFGGVDAYGDLTTALANPSIQSCVICVPHDLHEAYSSAAIAAERHVLLEKPIAHTMASAERIVRLAAGSAANKAFMIAEQMEYLPVLANLERLAHPQSYVFQDHGTYEPKGWRTRLESSGGGVMLDLGIHYVSLAVKAFGPIASHRRETRATIPRTDVPSAERLLIRHVNGVAGEVDVAWMQRAVSRKIEVRTRSHVFRYRQDGRFARLGLMPQFVCRRGANGREPMTAEYLARCRSSQPLNDVANALPVLAAVL